jgi:hypothetical protein
MASITALKANSQTVLAQFASAKIQFENSKTKLSAKVIGFQHGSTRLSRRGVYHRAGIP